MVLDSIRALTNLSSVRIVACNQLLEEGILSNRESACRGEWNTDNALIARHTKQIHCTASWDTGLARLITHHSYIPPSEGSLKRYDHNALVRSQKRYRSE